MLRDGDYALGGSAAERLLAAARAVFLERGYIGTSVDEIVQHAGMSKRSFYEHFQDRRDAYLQVVQSLAAQASFSIKLEGLGLEEMLLTWAECVYEAALLPAGLKLFQSSVAAHASDPALMRDVYGMRHFGARVLADALEAWRREGSIDFDDGDAAATRFSFGVIDGLRLLVGGAPVPAEERKSRYPTIVARYLEGQGSDRYIDDPAALLPNLPPVSSPVPGIASPSEHNRKFQHSHGNLLDKAWAVFSSEGYHGASLPEIAVRAGTSRNTLYRHFNSKSELFKKSCIRIIEKTYDNIPQPSGETADQLLQALARTLIQAATSRDSVHLHRLLIGTALDSPELSFAIYGRLTDSVVSVCRPAMTVLLEQDLIRPGSVEELSYRFFMLAVQGTRYLFTPRPSQRDIKSLATEATTQFLLGCRRRQLVR